MKKTIIDKAMTKAVATQLTGGALITASAYAPIRTPIVRMGVFAAGVGLCTKGTLVAKKRFREMQEEKYTTIR